jgi:hypothetical protein
MEKLSFNIQASSRQAYMALLIIVSINFCLLIGTFLCNTVDLNQHSFFIGFILRESNLAWENTLATWYSSMLLLTVALLAVLCFVIDRKANTNRFDNFLNYGWITIGLIFTGLSLDEIGSIHESIGNIDFFRSLGVKEALLSNTFYGLILIVGLFMTVFGFLRFKKNKWAIIFGILGVLLFITVPLQERLEWSKAIWDATAKNYDRSAYSIIIEEGTEIFGSLSFIICLVQYLVALDRKPEENENLVINRRLLINPKKLFISVIIVIFIFSLLNIAIEYEFLHIQKSDNGIPENWFPSMAAFTTSLISFYLYFDNKKSTNTKQKGLLLFSFLSLVMSAYFGSNLVNRVLEKAGNFSLLLNLTLSTIILLTAFYLIVKNKYFFTRIGLIIWSLFFCLIFFLHYTNAANLGFLSFTLLNLFFFFDLSRNIKKSNS